MDRLQELNLQTLEYRRVIADLAFLHKCIHRECILDTSLLYRLSPLQRLLRGAHSLRISLPFAIPNASLSTVASRVITIWNSFPKELVIKPSHLYKKNIGQLDDNILIPQSRIR